MKDLLLLIREDAGQPARLHAAISVARLMDGEITCFEVDERGAMNDEIASATVDGQVLRDLVRTQGVANKERVEGVLSREGVRWSWATGRGAVAEALGAEAAFHDLTIVNTQPRSYSWRDSSFLVSDLARATPQPLLLIPESDGAIDFTRRAWVGWDGSPPCIAALRAAVPLLARTEIVTMVEVGDHEEGASLDRGAEYLRRHGIQPYLERPLVADRASDWLLGRCNRHEDSWCVMGAFGRSRLREAAFGGTTLDMLDASRVPLFVAH